MKYLIIWWWLVFFIILFSLSAMCGGLSRAAEWGIAVEERAYYDKCWTLTTFDSARKFREALRDCETFKDTKAYKLEEVELWKVEEPETQMKERWRVKE